MQRFILEFFLFRFGTKELVRQRLHRVLFSLKESCEKRKQNEGSAAADSDCVLTFGRFCGVIGPELSSYMLDDYVVVFARACKVTGSCEQFESGKFMLHGS
jgi:hypothetical protein